MSKEGISNGGTSPFAVLLKKCVLEVGGCLGMGRRVKFPKVEQMWLPEQLSIQYNNCDIRSRLMLVNFCEVSKQKSVFFLCSETAQKPL